MTANRKFAEGNLVRWFPEEAELEEFWGDEAEIISYDESSILYTIQKNNEDFTRFAYEEELELV